MNDQTVWGLLFILYIIPAGIYTVWHQSESSALSERKRLYPGRTDVIEAEKRLEERLTMLAFRWCAGFAVLLGSWFIFGK